MAAFLKRFSVIFSTLLLIQCNIALLVNGEANQLKNADAQDIEKQSTKLSSSPKREKRFLGFLGHIFGALFGLHSLPKVMVGCDTMYPDLKINSQKIHKMVPKLKARATAFDAKWKQVNDSKKALTALMSHVRTLHFHLDRMDRHKLEVMHIMDEQYLGKTAESKEKVKSALNNLKPNEHMTPEMYKSYFHKSNEDFIKYTKELEPIKEWLGVDINFFYHMSKHTSTKMAGTEAIKMPSLMDDALKQLDKNSREYAPAKVSWDKFLFSAAYAFAVGETIVAIASFLGGPLAAAAAAFTMAAVGFGAIFTGIHALSTKLDCKHRSTKLKEHVSQLTHMQSKMDRQFTELANVKYEVEKNYKTVHDFLADEHFLGKLQEVDVLASTTLPQNQLTFEIIRKLREYFYHIRLQGVDKYIIALVGELIGAIKDTESLIDCFKSKMVLIGSISRDCAQGKTDANRMWSAVQYSQRVLRLQCPAQQSHQLQKIEFLELVRRLMNAQGKNTDCKGNLGSINQGICKDWFDYKQENEIYRKYSRLSRFMIQRELGNCRHGDLTLAMKDQICKLKENRQTEYDVFRKFHRHDKRQLSIAYLNCMRSQLTLDQDDKDKICKEKAKFVTLDVVEKMFQRYVGVKDVYNSCKPDTVQVCYAIRQHNMQILVMFTRFYPSTQWDLILEECKRGTIMNQYYGMNVKSESEHDLNRACSEAQFSYNYAKFHNDLSEKEMQKLLPVCKYIKH